MNQLPGSRFLTAVYVALLLWVGLHFLMCFGGVNVWEDAYMFSRYADHLLNEGTLSWNPGEGAVYGPTSPAWAVLVAGFKLVSNLSPALLLYTASVLTGIIFLFLLFLLAAKGQSGPPSHKRSQVLFFLLVIAAVAWPLANHFSSGMDTSLALLSLTLYFLLWKRFENRLSPGIGLVLGLAGGALWWIRPELVVFAFSSSLFVAVFSRRKIIRNQAVLVLLFTAFSLLLSWVFLLQIFGTLFPLSFFVKSGNPYGEGFMDFYRSVPAKELLAFLALTIPCWLAMASGFVKAKWKWRMLLSPAEMGILAAMLFLMVCFTFGVLQVMPFYSRFYFFVFPSLVFLSSKCLIGSWEPGTFLNGIFHSSLRISALVFLTIGLSLAGWWLEQRPSGIKNHFGKFSLGSVYEMNGKKTWPALNTISSLPDAIQIATTEVGLPGAWNPGKKILDLAGLNDRENAGKKFNADSFFEKHLPDVIYFPHPHYLEMGSEMRRHPIFIDKYVFFPAERTETVLGIAILKNSPWFQKIKLAVEENLAKKD